MILSTCNCGYSTVNNAGTMAKYLATSLAMENVVRLPRVISSLVNFFLNQRYVFASGTEGKGAFVRYVCTVLVVVCLSAWLTSSLHVLLSVSDNLVKIPVDILLFFLSYYLQRRWVFGGGAAREAATAGKKEA